RCCGCSRTRTSPAGSASWSRWPRRSATSSTTADHAAARHRRFPLIAPGAWSGDSSGGDPMSSVLWLQGGACSGNTMSFLNADEPNVVDLITDFGLDLIWHPSLGAELGDNAQKLFWDCVEGRRPLDIFVFEGTVMRGPNGTGRYDMFAGRPMKDWVTDLAAAAQIVVAIGDCA